MPTKTKKTNKSTQKKKKTAKPTRKATSRKESGQDIIQLILKDHQPLKKLLKVMKDTEEDHKKRFSALKEFVPQLLTHAKAEAQVLYTYIKENTDIRTEGFEGDVEHDLAEEVAKAIQNTEDQDLWSARVKVLAELVEHHIEEEEDEMLPDFKKEADTEIRIRLGEQYLQKKTQVEPEVLEQTNASDQSYVEPAHI